MIVQDLDPLCLTTTLGVLNQNQVHLKPLPLYSSIGLVFKSPHIGMTSRVRVLNGAIKTRVPSFPKLAPQPSVTNEGYGHLAANCSILSESP